TQPALLGGLKLRLDNLLVDGSIQSRLERVRRELA
ncbi:MAG: F0F1 ATP synthase subunit delta, partial [Candidatus Marinimicrobia bacterium]|nr:F0F1 ATP synthase subunit delta [Candidatus Neomarinimicrobiota bacterium]